MLMATLPGATKSRSSLQILLHKAYQVGMNVPACYLIQTLNKVVDGCPPLPETGRFVVD